MSSIITLLYHRMDGVFAFDSYFHYSYLVKYTTVFKYSVISIIIFDLYFTNGNTNCIIRFFFFNNQLQMMRIQLNSFTILKIFPSLLGQTIKSINVFSIKFLTIVLLCNASIRQYIWSTYSSLVVETLRIILIIYVAYIFYFYLLICFNIFGKLMGNVSKLAPVVNVEIKIPLIYYRKIKRVDVSFDSREEYFNVSIFIIFLVNLKSQLHFRFDERL